MDQDVIATHLQNLDRRLARVEQILPTVATKEELRILATKEDLRTLATKEDLRTLATKEEIRTLATREELRAAVAPLATKEELRQAVQEEGERSRRYMNVLAESLREDIHLIAAHVASANPKRPQP
jgi:hypothetical protein